MLTGTAVYRTSSHYSLSRSYINRQSRVQNQFSLQPISFIYLQVQPCVESVLTIVYLVLILTGKAVYRISSHYSLSRSYIYRYSHVQNQFSLQFISFVYLQAKPCIESVLTIVYLVHIFTSTAVYRISSHCSLCRSYIYRHSRVQNQFSLQFITFIYLQVQP